MHNIKSIFFIFNFLWLFLYNVEGLRQLWSRKPSILLGNEFMSSSSKKMEEGGEGSLGDIMSSYDTNTEMDARIDTPIQSGLVTNSGGTLLQSFGSKTGGYLTPLERIALTANGNLQRIFSSYYDAPVHIHVDYCQKSSSDNVWDRRVFLEVHSKTFCTALSKVYIRDKHCIHLVEDGSVGIGQLFRHLNILPLFCLNDVGRMDNGGIWRQYELTCKELTCHITEIFEPDAWTILEPPSSNLYKPRSKSNFVNENDLLF